MGWSIKRTYNTPDIRAMTILSKNYDLLYKECQIDKHRIFMGRTAEDYYHDVILFTCCQPEALHMNENELLKLCKLIHLRWMLYVQQDDEVT